MDREGWGEAVSSLEIPSEQYGTPKAKGAAGDVVEWPSFESCLKELLEKRERTLTPFDSEVARSVYSACSKALVDTEKSEGVWRAVSAPTGGGKTTAAFAFAAALVRSGGTVLFLASTMRECDEAYRALESLIPGKVAIRTSDHDRDTLEAKGEIYIEETKVQRNYTPTAFFNRSQLREYPALIGTHNGFKKHSHELLDLARGERRALILVDERPDDIDVADFTLADFEQIHELCRTRLGLDTFGDEPSLTKAFGEACRQLSAAHCDFDRSRPYHELTLTLGARLVEALKAFADSPAERSRLTSGTDFEPEDIRLAARLIILAQQTHGFAFAALHAGYSHGARFVAYAPNWPLRPGTVLLDATSDIDGYAELSNARVQEAVPEANYSKLDATHLDGPSYVTGWSPKELWEKAETRKPLLGWMHKCILENTKEGESVLIVSWKNVVDGGQLQLLDWKGRHVHFCHFGAGIGSNQWRDCGVVFIFGSYVKPARTMIAETHGIKETAFRANGDATVRGLKGDYRTTKVGLMLRWFKQLAMRGCARELDENGVAKPMRLCFSTDQFQLVVDHWERMFPGAPMPKAIVVGDEETQTDSKPRRRKSVADQLLKFLAGTTQDEVSSSDIFEATDIELKSAMRSLRGNAGFRLSCEKLGWSYVSGRGRGRKARFVRNR